MRTFFILYFIFLAAGGILLVIYPKPETFLIVNRAIAVPWHSSALEWFFIHITFLGNGTLSTGTVILLFLIKRRWGIAAAAGFIAAALLVYGLKHLVFDDMARPARLFAGDESIYYVPGVELLYDYSFPSGHSAAAFSVACFLSFLLKRRQEWLGAFYFLGALLIAFSRVFLAQHFAEDIYFGSVGGVLCAAAAYRCLAERRGEKRY